MKALVALSLAVTSLAHAEDKVKISPACRESARIASERLEKLNPALTNVDQLKFRVVEKRSIAYAMGVSCAPTYFQNYITALKDGILDLRRDLTPVNAEIERISKQNFAKYWWAHAQESWEGLKTLGAGRSPRRLLPETKSAYLSSLNEIREKLLSNLNFNKAELERISADSQRVMMLTGSQLDAEKALAEQEMYKAIWEARLLVEKERTFASGHSGCSKVEVDALQLEQFEAEVNGAPNKTKVFDVGALNNILNRLSESEPLDYHAKNILRNGCNLRNSYYSGDRAALLDGVKLED